jgi:hypothetical protein
MTKLSNLLLARLKTGFLKSSVKTASAWAEQYRVMGKPFPGRWNFKHHPWAREMHDAQNELIVGQKAAQMGFTEVALNRTFYAIDVLGESVLYVLPASTPDATDFSTSRFDPALELSTHLQELFSDVKNIGHKRAGNANLFIRGSRSRSQLKSIPVGNIVLDELDEMVQENISLVFERTSGQLDKRIFMLSTATIDDYGINKYYRDSSQDHFFFKCPHCSRQIELTFPDCMVITSDDWNSPAIYDTHIICPECKHRLEHEAKVDYLQTGHWVPTLSDRVVRGFHINQLYSMTIKPYQFATSYLKGLQNPSDEQEFYNSKLGMTHVVEGAKLEDSHIEACTVAHGKSTTRKNSNLITMGVDVGKWLHVTVLSWYLGEGIDVSTSSHATLLWEGKVLNFQDLDAIMHDFQVNYCVIDANPERRKALEFAQRFWGRVKMCFYATGINSKNISIHAEEDHSVSVDRTSWLDLTLSRIRVKRIAIPNDVSMEFKSAIKSLVRIYDTDNSGNPIGKYVCTDSNKGDHYAHALNYAEIALPLALGTAQSKDVK